MNDLSFKENLERLEYYLELINIEVDELDLRIKNAIVEKQILSRKYEDISKEKLKHNKLANSSMFAVDHATNFLRLPILIFEAIEMIFKTITNEVFKNAEYKQIIAPYKEEIEGRKKDLFQFIAEAEELEQQIILEINDFNQKFFSKNYSNLEEVKSTLEELSKTNKFATYLLEKTTKNNNILNIKDLEDELENVSSRINGVFKRNNNYKNIENLNRIKKRLNVILNNEKIHL